MSNATDPGECLGRVVEKGGRLLRSTLDPAPSGDFEALALTFDVGTVAFRAAGSELIAEAHPAGGGEAGTNADEEAPWWAVLGNPLTRVQVHEDGLLIQFRPDAESPKILALSAAGGAVRVRTLV